MFQKRNPPPLAGGNRAGIRQADAVDSACNREESLCPRGLTAADLAVIRKNAIEEIRVELSEFNGHDLINIRVWADARNGGAERIPTKAGIACNVRLLPELVEALRQAEIAVRNRDLL
jgi:hypothetical protein